jgi:hypothetical protein
MKKNLLLLAIVGCMSLSQAEYLIKYPPISNINFVNQKVWLPADPLKSEWTNSGAITGCSNWSPAISTVNQGVVFTQTATDCKQDQTRTVQEREKEKTSSVYRNIGTPYTETQSITVTSTQEAIGAKSIAKVCVYGSTWGQGVWYKSATNITLSWWGPNEAAGEKFSIVVPLGTVEYKKDNYLYTKGGGIFGKGDDIWYEICRVPI